MGGPNSLDHLADLYDMILGELEKADIEFRPSDAMLIEGLASQIATIRRWKSLIKTVNSAEAMLIAKDVELGALPTVKEYAQDLKLSEEAVARLLWVN